MQQVNMHDAKSRLSELVQLVESGEEPEVVIARNGRPVARLLAVTTSPDVSRRIGVAKGAFR
ncbi:MAG: type II toxin-antitoxin system prevent-host-death family antitoxin, partial [Spirochaetaceae bacterium]